MEVQLGSSQSTNESFPFWELDSDNKPKDSKDAASLIKFINFVDQYPEWIGQYPEQARAYCTLLDRTSLPSEKAIKVYRTLLKKHPTLFPGITITIRTDNSLIKDNNLTRCIPVSMLKEQSDKFRAMLKTGTAEME